MKNIEIKTAQNVVLEYELAGLRARVLACFIDLICLGVGISILSIFGAMIFGSSSTAYTIFGIMLICIFIFYSPAMEIFNNGQSIGKMAMRIQVIKTSGGKATLSDYMARWVFRMVDIYLSLGGLASILIASSNKEQRIGDIVANTAVIKIHSSTSMDLEYLLGLHAADEYKPKYLQVRRLQEEDVLLIKSTLDRYAQFKNDAHEEAIELLAERIKFVLSIENKDADERRFLQVILKDYVVLTR